MRWRARRAFAGETRGGDFDFQMRAVLGFGMPFVASAFVAHDKARRLQSRQTGGEGGGGGRGRVHFCSACLSGNNACKSKNASVAAGNPNVFIDTHIFSEKLATTSQLAAANNAKKPAQAKESLRQPASDNSKSWRNKARAMFFLSAKSAKTIAAAKSKYSAVGLNWMKLLSRKMSVKPPKTATNAADTQTAGSILRLQILRMMICKAQAPIKAAVATNNPPTHQAPKKTASGNKSSAIFHSFAGGGGWSAGRSFKATEFMQ